MFNTPQSLWVYMKQAADSSMDKKITAHSSVNSLVVQFISHFSCLLGFAAFSVSDQAHD